MKKISQSLFLLFSSLLVIFFVTEVFLRVTGIETPRRNLVSEENRFVRKPHLEFWHTAENKNYVKLNNYGFHDQDWNLSEDKDYYLLMGDSILEAKQVPIESNLTSLTTEKLQNPEIQLLNAGINGANTIDEYLLWKTYLSNIVKPKKLILFFFLGNDYQNNSLELRKISGKHIDRGTTYLNSKGEIFFTDDNYHPIQRIVKDATNHSAFLNLIYRRLYYLKHQNIGKKRRDYTENLKQTDYQAYRDRNRPVLLDAINGTLKLIEKWYQELINQNIEFSIVIIPPGKFAAKPDYGSWHHNQMAEGLLSFCEERRLKCLDLDLRRYDPNDLYFYSEGHKKLGHLNFKGHEVVAEQLSKWFDTKVLA